MKLNVTSSQRTTLGAGRRRITLMAGRAVQVDEALLRDLLEAGNGHGLKLCEAGVLTIEEPRVERVERTTAPEYLELEREGEGTPNAPSTPATLRDLTIAEAEPLIAAETDLDRLELWAEADERRGIHDAVANRLVELESAEPRTEGTDSDREDGAED